MIKGDLGLGKFVLQRPLSTSAIAFDFASLKKAGYSVGSSQYVTGIPMS